MILETENLSTAGEGASRFAGKMGDRQGAHYYRAQHARAVERARHWEQKTRASEKIIAQLLVLLGCFLQRIQELSRQLAWLRKQQFGRKSEAGSSPGPAEPEAVDGSRRAADQEDQSAQEAKTKSKTGRRRGQQRGGKGPKRKGRGNLPAQVLVHTLEESQRTCGVCGKVHPELALWEESQEVGWASGSASSP